MTTPWRPDLPTGAVQIRAQFLQALANRGQGTDASLLDSLVSAAGLKQYPYVTDVAPPDPRAIAAARYFGEQSVVLMDPDQSRYDSTGTYSPREIVKHEVGHLANLPADTTQATADNWRGAFDLVRDMVGVPQQDADQMWRLAPAAVREQGLRILRDQAGVFRGHPFLRSRVGPAARTEQAQQGVRVVIPDSTQENGSLQRALRNNNPGNLRWYDDGRHIGAENSGDGYSRFATPQAGWQALVSHLAGYQQERMPLRAFVETYAPRSDGNNPDKYMEKMKEWFPDADEWETTIDQLPLTRFAEAVAFAESQTRIERTEIAPRPR